MTGVQTCALPICRNESDQRRALLLPQEFKELGPERLVVIFENCKPILGEKIRYHREKVFKDRLRRAPPVPRMNMDLHLAKAQQRMRYADDELPAGQVLTLEDLAHDFSDLAVPGATGSKAEWDACIEGFLDRTLVLTADSPAGGSIEPVGEEPATPPTDIENAVALERDHSTTEH